MSAWANWDSRIGKDRHQVDLDPDHSYRKLLATDDKEGEDTLDGVAITLEGLSGLVLEVM